MNLTPKSNKSKVQRANNRMYKMAGLILNLKRILFGLVENK